MTSFNKLQINKNILCGKETNNKMCVKKVIEVTGNYLKKELGG
jgi:hypothetical protein